MASSQPSPMILLMGGPALVQVGVMISKAQLHGWVRFPIAFVAAGLGVLCIVAGVASFFRKKPPPPAPRVSRRAPPAPQVQVSPAPAPPPRPNELK